MIRRSYGTVEQTEASKNLAKEGTSLIVSSNVTYMEAQNALELVLETLETRTRPVIVQGPVQGDSKLMS